MWSAVAVAGIALVVVVAVEVVVVPAMVFLATLEPLVLLGMLVGRLVEAMLGRVLAVAAVGWEGMVALRVVTLAGMGVTA